MMLTLHAVLSLLTAAVHRLTVWICTKPKNTTCCYCRFFPHILINKASEFTWGHSLLFFEHPTEVTKIIESECLCNIF